MTKLIRAVARTVTDLVDPTPRVSKACLEAAILRQEMDRHPAEEMEPYRAVGTPLRPGDLRKTPIFEKL